jgi:hypothetical protein
MSTIPLHIQRRFEQRWAAQFGSLERFQAKWIPVRVKKTRQIKNLEPRFDSIETEKALVVPTVLKKNAGLKASSVNKRPVRKGQNKNPLG